MQNNVTVWATGFRDSNSGVQKTQWQFYNLTNMALIGFSTDTGGVVLNSTVATFTWGITDNHAHTTGTDYRLNNLILYTNGGTFPVWPGSNLQIPTNLSPAGVTAAIAAASNGDTIIIPATNATWTSGVTLNKDRVVMYGLGGTNSTVIISDAAITTFQVTGAQNTISNLQIRGDLTTDEADGFHNENLSNRYSRIFMNGLAVAMYAKQAGLMDNCIVVDANFSSRNIWGNSFYDSLYPLAWDSLNYFVYEDCKFYWTSGKNTTGSRPMMSSQQGDAWVVRHCYFEFNNASTDPAPVFDFHGESPGLGRPGVALQIYSNYYNFISGSVSGQKFVDVRGTRSLIYSNKFVGATYDSGQGIFYRDEDTPDYKVNNSYVWENKHGVSGTTAMPINDDANIAAGADYFTVALDPLVAIAYPHPFRNESAPGPVPFTPAAPRIRGIRIAR
jgi:hypothetical protein